MGQTKRNPNPAKEELNVFWKKTLFIKSFRVRIIVTFLMYGKFGQTIDIIQHIEHQ